jgi:hypothetical protein
MGLDELLVEKDAIAKMCGWTCRAWAAHREKRSSMHELDLGLSCQLTLNDVTEAVLIYAALLVAVE